MAVKDDHIPVSRGYTEAEYPALHPPFPLHPHVAPTAEGGAAVGGTVTLVTTNQQVLHSCVSTKDFHKISGCPRSL